MAQMVRIRVHLAYATSQMSIGSPLLIYRPGPRCMLAQAMVQPLSDPLAVVRLQELSVTPQYNECCWHNRCRRFRRWRRGWGWCATAAGSSGKWTVGNGVVEIANGGSGGAASGGTGAMARLLSVANIVLF